MDHLRISGTEPSSVIRSRTKQSEMLECDVLKVPKGAKVKTDGVNYNANYSRKLLVIG